MKIAKVGDLHIGARGANRHVRDFIDKWCRYLFEDMKNRGVDKYVQLGDAFDTRKALDGLDFEWVRNEFIPLHEKNGVEGYYIPGNHDIPYKESCRISWVHLLGDLSPRIHVFDTPGDRKIGDVTCCFLPWICMDNVVESLAMLEESEADWCFAHLELGGFEMYKNSPCLESRFNLNATHFKNFKRVLTGHFHTKSQKGNIDYVGTPYPLTWQDWADAEQGLRGYHILDTETGELEFIANPEHVKSMFKVFTYNWEAIKDDSSLQIQLKTVSELETTHDLAGKIVKILVEDRGNAKHYKDFVDAVRRCKTIDTTYIDMTMLDAKGAQTAHDFVCQTAGDEQNDELRTQTDIVQVMNERLERSGLDAKYHNETKSLIASTYDISKDT